MKIPAKNCMLKLMRDIMCCDKKPASERTLSKERCDESNQVYYLTEKSLHLISIFSKKTTTKKNKNKQKK